MANKNPKQPLISLRPKDFIRETFRVGGNGGQNVNKVETGVRYRHEPSGAVAEGREHRTQGQNERAAIERIKRDPRLLTWIKMESIKEVRKQDGLITLEAEVDEMMRPENLKIEVKEKNKWASISPEEMDSSNE